MGTKLCALMAAGHCAIKVEILHAMPKDVEASNVSKQLLEIQLCLATSMKT